MDKLHLAMIGGVVVVAGIFLYLVWSNAGPAVHQEGTLPHRLSRLYVFLKRMLVGQCAGLNLYICFNPTSNIIPQKVTPENTKS